MSTSISGLGSNAWMLSQSASSASRASKMAEDLFSKLDTAGNGYLTESQLATAFGNVSSSAGGSSSTSASDVFKALDSNGDGKLTKSELTDSLAKLFQQLDSQFGNSRLDQARGNMPPPPPPGGGDQGLTTDQMTQMLSNTSSSDPLYNDLKTTLANFSAADTNGDGKVTFQEMMAYEQSSASSASSSTTASSSSNSSSSSLSSSSSSSTTASNDAAIMKRILDLLAAYGFTGSNNSSSVSLTA